MKNFLNITLTVLLVFLVLNLFVPKDKVEKTGLDVSFVKNTYTIPASVGVNVSNFTDKDISLNTCENLEIRKSGEKMSFPAEFCEDIIVKANSTQTISYQKYFESFNETGKYSLKATFADDKEFNSETTVENKGTISKLFTTLIYAPIYNLFIFLIKIFNGSFGWAIIAVTLIIRLLLLWPQHKSLIAQRRLQEIQPKIKKLQEEYKNNQQVLGVKLLELYKKENVNPMGSCGFLLIQLPIVIVLYRIILGIQNYSNTYYIYNFLGNFSFEQIKFDFFGLDLLQIGGTQGIILALIVGVIQFIQLKVSFIFQDKNKDKKGVVLEKKSGSDAYSQMMPDPEVMNKVMLYTMPLFIGFITYTIFAGVGIYWGISTLFMLIQQIIVNKLLKKEKTA